MSKLLLLNDFIAFLEEELLLEKGEANSDTYFRQLRTWSSLNALILISRINELSDVLLTASDLAKCETIAQLHQVIVEKHHG